MANRNTRAADEAGEAGRADAAYNVDAADSAGSAREAGRADAANSAEMAREACATDESKLAFGSDAVLVAVDQSTSGTKALVIDRVGRIVSRCDAAHTTHYPRPGWVEHDPLELYANVRRAIRESLERGGIDPRRVAAVTIANQRETAVVWDRETGQPVYNAIVWQCRRTSDACERLRAAGVEPEVRAKTGLVLDPYFSAGKFRWLLDYVRAVAAGKNDGSPATGESISMAETRGGSHGEAHVGSCGGGEGGSEGSSVGELGQDKAPTAVATAGIEPLTSERAAELLAQPGRLLAGTVDSWLIWKLTGGTVHATDATNASRTSLYNIVTHRWDESLIRLFGVQELRLPEVRDNTALYGHIDDSSLFPSPVPITGVIGDSQGALFAQLCLEPGDAKATYGTGTSVMMNIGSRPVFTEQGLVTALAWSVGGQVNYALEGIIHSSGDTMKWLRELGLYDSYEEAERLAASLPDNGGVYLVPAFVGLGAPYWKPDARAAIVGMNRGAGRAELIRAGLESIAYQVGDIAELMREASGVPLSALRADGGAAANTLLMQMQADLLGAPVEAADRAELSAMGSAYLGGLGVGFWKSAEELQNLPRSQAVYRPSAAAANWAISYGEWQAAVRRITG